MKINPSSKSVSKPFFRVISMLGVVLTGCYLVFQTSCTRNRAPLLSNLPDSCTMNISFSKNILPIINVSCAIPGCHYHGSTAPDDFTIPANVIADARSATADMKNRVNHTGSNPPMPASGSITACQIAQITSWINAGAPDN